MDPRGRIGNMDALLFALSLEVVLLQMRILDGSIVRAQRSPAVNKRERLQRDKLVKDRNMVKDVMRKTLIEVAESGEWCTLKKAVDILNLQASSAISKRLKYDQLVTFRNAVIEELETKRSQRAIELRNADQGVAMLRDKINDVLLNANARLCYVEKWVFARAESLELQLQYEGQREPAPRVDHERRVHNELMKAYELQIKEREDALEYWRRRYSTDIAQINKRVAEKSEDHRVATARRVKSQKLFDLHEGEMRSWLTFKRERAARLEREERLRTCATRIQAWWRGLMVRRALGAFRHLRNSKKSPVKIKKK